MLEAGQLGLGVFDCEQGGVGAVVCVVGGRGGAGVSDGEFCLTQGVVGGSDPSGLLLHCLLQLLPGRCLHEQKVTQHYHGGTIFPRPSRLF